MEESHCQIYTGGGDPNNPKSFWMKRLPGMYVSSCGEYWGSKPFTAESEKKLKRWDRKRKWRETLKKLK